MLADLKIEASRRQTHSDPLFARILSHEAEIEFLGGLNDVYICKPAVRRMMCSCAAHDRQIPPVEENSKFKGTKGANWLQHDKALRHERVRGGYAKGDMIHPRDIAIGTML